MHAVYRPQLVIKIVEHFVPSYRLINRLKLYFLQFKKEVPMKYAVSPTPILNISMKN